MSDNWEKLLQLSVPRESHRASSTGLFEETDADRSILDLGSKSPSPKPSLDKTGVADVTGLDPVPPINPDLFWGGPNATSVNDSEDSIESGVKEILVFS